MLENKNHIIQLLSYYKYLGIDYLIEDVKSLQTIENNINENLTNNVLITDKKITKDIIHNNNNNNNSNNKPQEIELLRSLSDINSINELKVFLESFNKCPLKNTALKTVVGDGNHNADIIVVGEAPGSEEDEQGIPFVGRSGKLLMKAFESIGLTRDNIFITNCVFWRPPGNREPSQKELEQCYPFLKKIIELVNPKLILMIGSVSSRNILREKLPLSKMRGKWYDEFEGQQILLRALYHPAYLLRSPSKKKDMWKDLLIVKNKIQEIKINV